MTSQFISQRKTITEIAEELGISREFLHKYYIKLAQQSTEFPKDYPKLGNKTFTNIGLTRFQEWVLLKLREFVSAGLTKQQFLIKDSEGFVEFASEIDEYLSRKNYLEETHRQPQSQTAELANYENY